MDTPPFVPEGAPPRPVWPQLSRHFVLCFMVIMFGFPLAEAVGNISIAVTICGLLLCFLCAYIVSLWRTYNRMGWYEMKPIEVPSLPFPTRYGSKEIIFQQDSVVVDSSIMVFGKHKVVPYEEIVSVETLCKGVFLRGVELHLREGKSQFINNEYGDGEPARTALAILRQKAPHARFEGPKWVEEGWVPRFGFSYPNSG